MGFFSSISSFVKKHSENFVKGAKEWYWEWTMDITVLEAEFAKNCKIDSEIAQKKKALEKYETELRYDMAVVVGGTREQRNRVYSRQNREIEKKLEPLKQEIQDLENERKHLFEEYKRKAKEKRLTQNDDMIRMEQIIKETIPQKTSELSAFNSRLAKSIEDYKKKGMQVIEIAYGKVLGNTGIRRKDYYNQYSAIYGEYSLKINPVVMASCDATIKKIRILVQQKEDLISKNNLSIEKYMLLSSKLQQKYDDEFAILQIKNLNTGINTAIENSSDIAQGEVNNISVRNLIDDVEALNREIEERRNLEIKFGTIEI